MKKRMLGSALGLLVGFLSGCTPERPFDPGTDLPEWAFDKREYSEPAVEPEPFRRGVDGQPDIYYVPQHIVYIKHPGPDVRQVPRPAVYTTTDNGQTWKKEGHFGRGQTYFVLRAPQDGRYGVCVIRPQQGDLGPANLRIQMIYIIDSQAPQIEVTVSPKEGPYWPGQQVELAWKISDPHLDDLPGVIYSRTVQEGKVPVWKLQNESLAASGTMSVTIEQFPSRVKGLQFRIQAKDQMDNIATGYSPLLELSYPLAGSAKSATVVAGPPVVKNDWPEKAGSSESVGESSPTTIIISAGGGAEESGSAVAGEPSSALPELAGPDLAVVEESASAGGSEEDGELSELESLLPHISGAMFGGRVYEHQPKAAGLAKARSPAEGTAELEPVGSETALDLPRIVIKGTPEPPQPEGFVVARPMAEHIEKPVIQVAGGQEEVAADGASTEPAPLMVPTREKLATEGAGAIVTVRPAGEPVVQAKPKVEGAGQGAPVEPLPPAELPEPLITAKPKVTFEPPSQEGPVLEVPVPALPKLPSAEPGAVVTVRPAAKTDKPKAPKTPAPQTRVASAAVATVSHGPKKMAKPWERLGRRGAAARDFYLHAPSLSNY